MSAQAVLALQQNASQFGIAQILYKGNGIEIFGDPTINIRVPDIAIRVQPGVCATPQGRNHECLHARDIRDLGTVILSNGQLLLSKRAQVADLCGGGVMTGRI